MRFNVLNEGEVVEAGAHIVDVKNNVADRLARIIKHAGLSDPDIEYAEDVSDETIIYSDISRNYTLMVRVVTDTDIQIQIPQKLAARLGMHDYHNTGSIREAAGIIIRIASKIRI